MTTEQMNVAADLARFIMQASNLTAGSDAWKQRLSTVVDQLLVVGNLPTGTAHAAVHSEITAEVTRLATETFVPKFLRKPEAPALSVAA